MFNCDVFTPHLLGQICETAIKAVQQQSCLLLIGLSFDLFRQILHACNRCILSDISIELFDFKEGLVEAVDPIIGYFFRLEEYFDLFRELPDVVLGLHGVFFYGRL